MARKKAVAAIARTGNGKLPIANTGKAGAGSLSVISSTLSYEGPLFRVYTDHVVEKGVQSPRDVIRHHGSVVILALDNSKSKRDPLVVIERQYRHAAGQYLLELPAGKMEEGEKTLAGAKRELLEETGYSARRWRKLIRFYPSPGFLGEAMQVYVAEELTAGPPNPDYDEHLEIRMIPLSKLIQSIEQGKIIDGKTILSVLAYERSRRRS